MLDANEQEMSKLNVQLMNEFEQMVDDHEQAKDFDLELDFLDDEKQEDKLWMARTGLNEKTLCGAIETIIFMSDKPVALQKIKSLIDPELPLRVIHSALELLVESYEKTIHGIRLVEVAHGYQFRTKATYSKYVQDLFKVSSLVLTPSALEVLAIVAYKQPVTKSEVSKIRGVDSSHLVKGLMDKRLVKISARSNDVGHPSLYSTTQEFLEVFNLDTISSLPSENELEDMIGTQEVGRIEDIKNITSADKTKFIFDEIEELETLSQSIKTISSDTEFTKSLKVQDKKRINDSGEEVMSAFDLLEVYVNREAVKKSNESSVNSEMLMAALDPNVIHDLEAGPFNTPETDDEFEMIDLDTGLPIEEEGAIETIAQALENAEIGDLDEDLDRAFSKLMDENVPMKALDEEDLPEIEDGIDALTSEIIQKGDELDIDLSFMNDELNSVNNSTEENILQ